MAAMWQQTAGRGHRATYKDKRRQEETRRVTWAERETQADKHRYLKAHLVSIQTQGGGGSYDLDGMFVLHLDNKGLI